MDGGHGSVVARVHGFQHGVGLGASALADDDAVGTFSQGGDEVIVQRNLAHALGIRLSSLETHDMGVFLVNQKLAGILDSEDSLAVRDEPGQHVQERGLARSCAA